MKGERHMKELTKQIRKAVKEKIEEVGGSKNLLNRHVNEIHDSIMKMFNIKEHTNQWIEMLTTTDNQIDYFRFTKGL